MLALASAITVSTAARYAAKSAEGSGRARAEGECRGAISPGDAHPAKASTSVAPAAHQTSALAPISLIPYARA